MTLYNLGRGMPHAKQVLKLSLLLLVTKCSENVECIVRSRNATYSKQCVRGAVPAVLHNWYLLTYKSRIVSTSNDAHVGMSRRIVTQNSTVTSIVLSVFYQATNSQQRVKTNPSIVQLTALVIHKLERERLKFQKRCLQ